MALSSPTGAFHSEIVPHKNSHIVNRFFEVRNNKPLKNFLKAPSSECGLESSLLVAI